MQNKTRRRKSYGTLAVVIAGACMAYAVSLATAPDQDLHFTRIIPSPLDASRLDRNVSSVTRWPQWFFSLAHVNVTPPAELNKTAEKGTRPETSQVSMIKKGALLTLNIDPKKWQSKKFQLVAKVMDYNPGHELRLQILDDSSGRLTKLFDHLEWKIEFLPSPKNQGTLIRATSSAHTHNWRSRFFGQIAEKILMNQIFYPDVVKLAELRQPFSGFEETSHPVPPITN